MPARLRLGLHDEAHALERPARARTRTERWLLVVAGSVAMILPAAPAPAAVGRPDLPTWSDEFAGGELDLSRWAYRASGIRRQGVLTPEAVSVADDVLTIRTYTEDDLHFTGMIATRGATAPLEQAFGYFEARMKFSSAPGQWSAFWLQSPTLGTPLDDPQQAGVEMDVVEHRVQCVVAPPPAAPQPCADRAQSALVWNGYGEHSQSAINLGEPLPGLSNGTWHTWALNWTPSAVTFLFDDRPIWSRTAPISQRSQHVVLSSEVWDGFAGPIPPGGYGPRATSTTNVQVDYVRAWSTPAGAPHSTSPPVVSGAAQPGGALTCSAGTWSGVPVPVLDLRWLSDGSALADATGPTYTVQSSDRGHALSCRVTATSVGGIVSADAGSVAIPAAPVPAPQLMLAPFGAPPPPLAPPPPADTRAPHAVLSGATSQRLGTSVSVRVACRDEPCRAAATGSIRVPRIGRAAKARTYKPTAVAVIGRAATATLRLKLSRGARAAIRRALRARRRVSAVLRVRVIDGAGNARTLHRTVAVKLPPRRSGPRG